MSDFSLELEYVLPQSRKHSVESLKLSTDRYEGFLKYLLPIDSKFTNESGNVKLQLKFSKKETDENGNIIERIRKTYGISVNIESVNIWDEIEDKEDVDVSDLPSVQENANSIVGLDGRIKNLEEIVGDGFVAITSEQIDSMFV